MNILNMFNKDKPKIEPNEALLTDYEYITNRLEAGLVAPARIENGDNKPIFIEDDIVYLMKPQRVEKADFILHERDNEYFIRRVIKFKDDAVFVANDTEDVLHVVQRDEILGRVIGFVRGVKYISLSLKKNYRHHTYKMTHNLKKRFENRVLDEEDENNIKSFQIANEKTNELLDNKPHRIEINLDSELKNLMDPSELAIRYLEEHQ